MAENLDPNWYDNGGFLPGDPQPARIGGRVFTHAQWEALLRTLTDLHRDGGDD